MEQQAYVVIVSDGPGGYQAALRGAQLEMTVACVEKRPRLGGPCPNIGCIPSKALPESSERYSAAQHQFAEHGILFREPIVDLRRLLEHEEADEVLGVHVIGPDAGTLIHEALLVMEFEALAEDIASVCLAHPTLPEALKANGARLGAIALPVGVRKQDPFFGDTEVYTGPFQVTLPIHRDPGVRARFTVIAFYQGCNGRLGICYPPAQTGIAVSMP